MTECYYAHLDVSTELIRFEHGLLNKPQKPTNHGPPLYDIVTINMDEGSRGPCLRVSSEILLRRHVGHVDIRHSAGPFQRRAVQTSIRDCLICSKSQGPLHPIP